MKSFKLEELLEDYEIGHSSFQIDNFIINQTGITVYGQYKQALIELYSRFNNLKIQLCDKISDELKEKKIEQSIEHSEEGSIDNKLAKLELIKFKLQQEEKLRTLESSKREFNRFYKHACLLKEKLTTEHGPLTKTTKADLEEQYWETKIKKDIALQLQTTGRISESLYDALLSLSQKIKCNIFCELKNPNNLIEWLNTHSIDTVDQQELNSAESYIYSELELFEKKLLGE